MYVVAITSCLGYMLCHCESISLSDNNNFNISKLLIRVENKFGPFFKFWSWPSKSRLKQLNALISSCRYPLHSLLCGNSSLCYFPSRCYFSLFFSCKPLEFCISSLNYFRPVLCFYLFSGCCLFDLFIISLDSAISCHISLLLTWLKIYFVRLILSILSIWPKNLILLSRTNISSLSSVNWFFFFILLLITSKVQMFLYYTRCPPDYFHQLSWSRILCLRRL